jgi:hypothetical protein
MGTDVVDLEFRITTLTPLFLGGAEQQPQLRAASLVPLMRWWFRALVGGLGGLACDPPTVRRLDEATFGSTCWARPARVKLTTADARPMRLAPDSYGIAYMLGPGLQPRDGRGRECFDAGSTFQLGISGLPRSLAPRWLAAIWLLSTLGGLGARAHRCFGRIEVTPCCDLDELAPLGPLGPEADSGKQWKDLFRSLPRTGTAGELGHRLRVLRNAMREDLRKSGYNLGDLEAEAIGGPLPQFSVLAPRWALLKILSTNQTESGAGIATFEKWQDAIDFAGLKYRKAREDPNSSTTSFKSKQQTTHGQHSKDWAAVQRFFNGKDPGDLKLHLLGLPVQFRREEPLGSERRKVWSAHVAAASKEINRYSPVWWPVFRLDGEPAAYAVGLLVFFAAFVPNEVAIQLRGEWRIEKQRVVERGKRIEKQRVVEQEKPLEARPVSSRDPTSILQELFNACKGDKVDYDDRSPLAGQT